MQVGGTIWNLPSVPSPAQEARPKVMPTDDRQFTPVAGSTPVDVRARRAPRSTGERPEVQIEGLRAWSGRVIAVEPDYFVAEVHPERGTAGAPIVADFEEGLLGRAAVVGDLFYMTKRIVETADGRRLTHRSIALRRLGRWHADELAALREQARARAARVQRLVE